MRRRSPGHHTATKPDWSLPLALLFNITMSTKSAWRYATKKYLKGIGKHVAHLCVRQGISYDGVWFHPRLIEALLYIECKLFQEASDSTKHAFVIARMLGLFPPDADNPPPHVHKVEDSHEWLCAIAEEGCRKISIAWDFCAIGKIALVSDSC